MKTKEEILNQVYITPKDVKFLIQSLGIDKCRLIIEEVQKEMKEKNYYMPPCTKPKRALTKLVKKKLGL